MKRILSYEIEGEPGHDVIKGIVMGALSSRGTILGIEILDSGTMFVIGRINMSMPPFNTVYTLYKLNKNGNSDN